MLTAGLHTVTVMDANGCTTTCDVTITEPAVLTCMAGEDSAVVCNGESNGVATVTAVGGNTSGGGVLDCSTAPAPIVYIASSDGTGDGSCTTGGEFIEICVTAECPGCETNVGVDLTGWEVEDEATNDGNPATSINITSGILLPGECVVIYSGYTTGDIASPALGSMGSAIGIGSDRASCPLWNSGGDTAFLYDGDSQAGGALIDQESTTAGASTYDVPVVSCPAVPTSGYTFVWDNGETAATATMLTAGLHVVTVTDELGCTTTCDVTITEPVALTCTAVEDTPAVCNGEANGVATVTPIGGNSGYTFAWDNGETAATATALSAGLHTVTVTDMLGCTTTCQVMITQPGTLTCAATEDTPVVCNGESNGIATVTPTGGNGGNTFAWDNGETTATATALSAGLHVVTVTDMNGCTTTCDVTITEPEVLTCAAAEDTPVICNGEANGVATVTPVGGNGGDTFAWDNGETTATATMLTAGLHTVTVTDMLGCTTTCEVTITEPEVLTCAAAEDTPVVCNGEANGTATVTPTGGNGGYTFVWDNGETAATATMLTAGLHTVTVTDMLGCTTTCEVTITEPEVLTCAAAEDTPVVCNGEANGAATVTAVGGNGGNTFAWDNGETTTTATMLTAGLHTVTVTDMIGCTATADSIRIDDVCSECTDPVIDDIVEFNDYYAFLCDVVPALFVEYAECEYDQHTVQGLRRHCSDLKDRSEQLENRLEMLCEQSYTGTQVTQIKPDT